jgi:hypothetical protein
VAYTKEGVAGWVELKFCSKNKPAHMRKTQIMWIRENLQAGGFPLILAAFFDGESNQFGLISGKAAIMKLRGHKNYAAWLRACGIVDSDLGMIINWLKTPPEIPAA